MTSRHLRIPFALVLLVGVVAGVPSRSIAQQVGSELAEPVAADADAAEGEAYVALTSVDAFPVDGGDAIFEPGTANEEAFSYEGVDAEASRLVGITRPAPVAHSTGVFVAAPEAASPEDTAATTDQESTSAGDGGDGADESTSSNGAEAPPEDDTDASDSSSTGTEQSDSSSGTESSPDPCYALADQSCAEVVGSLVSDPCGDTQTLVCEAVLEIIHDLEFGDPCDPNDTGQTCMQYVDALITNLWNQCALLTDCKGYIDDVCDPDDSAQTCEGWLLGIPTAGPGGCGVVPGDVSSGGTYVTGPGRTVCTKEQRKISAEVCIMRKIDGEWELLDGSCGVDVHKDATEAEAKGKAICAPGTHKYRVWMFGAAVHKGGGKFYATDEGPASEITCHPGGLP